MRSDADAKTWSEQSAGGAVLAVVSVVLAAVLLLALAYAVATHKFAASDRLGLVALVIALIAVAVLRYARHRAKAEEVASTTDPRVASAPDRPERNAFDPSAYPVASLPIALSAARLIRIRVTPPIDPRPGRSVIRLPIAPSTPPVIGRPLLHACPAATVTGGGRWDRAGGRSRR